MARILVVFSVFLITPLVASAGFININGSPQIKVHLIEDDQVNFKINHGLINTGNDRAEEVYSKISIGEVVFEGDSRSLPPRKSTSWSFDKTVPISDLKCESSYSCLAGTFPLAGRFPVLITIYYRDINGYSFSKTLTDFVEIGSFTGANGREMRNPQVNYTFELERDRDDDYGEIVANIENRERSKREYVFLVNTSDEVEVDRKPINFSLEPKEEKRIELEIENDKGLAGSGYAVNGVLITGSDDIRSALNHGRVFFIPHKKPMQAWWALFVLSLLMGPAFLFYLNLGNREQ